MGRLERPSADEEAAESCSSSGPPSEPAVALETVASSSMSESDSLHGSFDSLTMIVIAFSRLVRTLSSGALVSEREL